MFQNRSQGYFLFQLSLVFLVALWGASSIAENQSAVPDSLAENPPAENTLDVAENRAPSEAKVLGAAEIRPSWTSKQGEIHTEDYVELGYQFSNTVKLTYAQNFTTNLVIPSSPNSNPPGLGFVMNDGFARIRVNDIWVSQDKLTSFSYQGRIYLPTYGARADQGFLSMVRNYLKLSQKVTDSVTTYVATVPSFFAYSRAGSGAGAKAAANPWFENMLIWETDIQITQKLSFAFPLVMQITKYRDFDIGSKLSGQWGYNVWMWPELDYAITPNYTVGVAYYSDNLVKADLSAPNLGVGLEKGVTQLVFTATL